MAHVYVEIPAERRRTHRVYNSSGRYYEIPEKNEGKKKIV